MNFLGHLFLSGDNHELMLTNLYGDYIKGSKWDKYPEPLEVGAKFHRKIDYFIDNHKAVKELRLKLYKPLPKVAGIAIDLYFDFFLVRNWQKFSNINLDDFLNEFFKSAQNKITKFKNDFNFNFDKQFLLLIDRIHKEKWIQQYGDFEGLNFAASGLSRRISFQNNLDQAVSVLKQNFDEIEKVFFIFMNDAVEEFFC